MSVGSVLFRFPSDQLTTCADFPSEGSSCSSLTTCPLVGERVKRACESQTSSADWWRAPVFPESGERTRDHPLAARQWSCPTDS